MGGYVLAWLLPAIPVLLDITVIVFVIMAMNPDDPASGSGRAGMAAVFRLAWQSVAR